MHEQIEKLEEKVNSIKDRDVITDPDKLKKLEKKLTNLQKCESKVSKLRDDKTNEIKAKLEEQKDKIVNNQKSLKATMKDNINYLKEKDQLRDQKIVEMKEAI